MHAPMPGSDSTLPADILLPAPPTWLTTRQPEPKRHQGTQQQRRLRDAVQYNAELVEQVHREAREATALPGWFWAAAPIVLVGAAALSAAFPWGFAQ